MTENRLNITFMFKMPEVTAFWPSRVLGTGYQVPNTWDVLMLHWVMLTDPYRRALTIFNLLPDLKNLSFSPVNINFTIQ